ncbi:hypothetical protein FNU79_01335 [Deinococcus detaillensis]|uniref:Periplasmic heavy metal sensor n=1 Tax=Deinococcus detaillensis TaxID=2592048 RepID=A0A553V664_9DEIO|nr:hypothetical protein [Deinococcus detaillensis]TSA87916.1 hypothetical protein FNU79_01335 [Deinococcus detaillensis]
MMPKNILKILTISASLLLGAASAQQGQPAQRQGGQQRQIDPAQRARFQAMRPVFDLASRVSLMAELEKNKAQAVTKAQAKQLVPLLQKLQTSASISGADATKMLSRIEDKILTDKQVTALDDLDLKRQEDRRAARAKQGSAQQGGGIRIPGLPGGGFGGQNRQGQAGQAGTGGAPAGGSFNPFKQGREAAALKAYIALLQKK